MPSSRFVGLCCMVVACWSHLASSTPIASLSLPRDVTTANDTAFTVNTAYGDDPDYNVPGTNTYLAFASAHGSIDRAELGRTILYTKQLVADYIQQHRARDTPVISLDDPYESEPNKKAYICIETWPHGNPHLTYGVVADVLQGIWLYMYIGRRTVKMGFIISLGGHFGQVGIGRVLGYDPREQPDHLPDNQTFTVTMPLAGTSNQDPTSVPGGGEVYVASPGPAPVDTS